MPDRSQNNNKPTILFIALVHPGFSRFETIKYGEYRSFELLSHKFAVLSLVAWLRVNDCEGFYVWTEPGDPETLSKIDAAIDKHKPDALGFSLCTDEIMSHTRLIEKLKEKYPDLPIMVGGPHVCGSPRHTLEHFPAIDYIAIGDGEYILTEWLQKIARGAGKSDMMDVKGLGFRNDSGEIVFTPQREKIPDINILPEPAYDLVVDTNAPLDPKLVFPIFCSYGCRFFCTFCAADHGNYRFVNPIRVVDRIEWAHRNMSAGYFSILDGLWPPSREWLEEFCTEIENRKLDIKFQFATRAESLTEEHFARLKKIGTQVIVIGIEAGDPAILKAIKKGITPGLAKKAFKALNKVGIFSAANFMLGNQGENRETIQATIDLAHELNPSIALFRVHCPIPGTEAFGLVPDEGKDYWMSAGDDRDWWLGRTFPTICELPTEEMEDIAREAYLKYPLRWSYLRQHVLSGKLPSDYQAIARNFYMVHLRRYLLGTLERFWLTRKLIHGIKSIAKK